MDERNMTAQEPETESGISLMDFWMVLKKYLMQIVILTCIVTIIAGVSCKLLVKTKYTAQAVIILNPSLLYTGNNANNLQDVQADRNAILYGMDMMPSLIKFIKTSKKIKKAVDESSQTQENVESLNKGELTVSNASGELQLVLTYTTTTSPEVAVATLNELIKQVIRISDTQVLLEPIENDETQKQPSSSESQEQPESSQSSRQPSSSESQEQPESREAQEEQTESSESQEEQTESSESQEEQTESSEAQEEQTESSESQEQPESSEAFVDPETGVKLVEMADGGKYRPWANTLIVDDFADTATSSNKWVLYTAIAFALGLILSYFYYFTVTMIDDTIKSKTVIEKISGFHVMAYIEELEADTKQNKKSTDKQAEKKG